MASKRWYSSRKLKWALLALLLIIAAVVYGSRRHEEADAKSQVAGLVELLELKPGTALAEVGAGGGRMTVLMAERLRPASQVFATELNAARLEDIRNAVADAGLGNVTVIEGAEQKTNLPAQCCDVIFMTNVYHHFTDPSTMNASLLEALRPGGRLAVIDFGPGSWLSWLPEVEGTPKNRGGHGMPKEILVEELRGAGFQVEQVIDDWASWPKRYCVVARKPA